MKSRLTLLALLFLAVTVCGGEEIIGTVTGNLRVRTEANTKSEVLCLLEKGAQVTVLEFKGEWLGIKPPADAKAWVLLGSIKDGKVAVDQLEVRSGPAEVFATYATLKRGDTVKVLRTKHDKWAEIEAPANGMAWIHGDYVALPEKYRRQREEIIQKTQPLNVTHEGDDGKDSELVKIVRPLKGQLPKSLPVVPPKDYQVHELEGEPETSEINTLGMAKTVTRSGVIVKLDANKKRPWKYAMAAQINNVFYPLFYIGNEFPNVEQWEWHRVTITGEQHWLRGWPRPLVEVKKIQEIADAPAKKE